VLICPACSHPIHDEECKDILCSCGVIYPRLTSGGVDFLSGKEFHDFHLDPADEAQRALLENEAAGVAWRSEVLLLPLLRRFSRAAGKKLSEVTVLDCGCGSGIAVDILRSQGLQAYGIDAGRARHRQWEDRSWAAYLHSADALSLPFQNSSFDAVFSSGLVEHIGIHEEEEGGYRAERLPGCDAQRQRFVSELVRVGRPAGFILVDHPNGGFPVDFWHGASGGRLRWHRLAGDMLPRFQEMRRYFLNADPDLNLISLSPRFRLRFRQVAAHWYGRIGAPFMGVLFRLMEVSWLGFLARSMLNPYLVTLAVRHRSPRWVSSRNRIP